MMACDMAQLCRAVLKVWDAADGKLVSEKQDTSALKWSAFNFQRSAGWLTTVSAR